MHLERTENVARNVAVVQRNEVGLVVILRPQMEGNNVWGLQKKAFHATTNSVLVRSAINLASLPDISLLEGYLSTMSAKSTWNACTVLRIFYFCPVSEALTRMQTPL